VQRTLVYQQQANFHKEIRKM